MAHGSGKLTAGLSDQEKMIREQVAITMDIHPDATAQYRTYPSIRDYYEANVTDRNKPVQLQNGLSNYSSLVLGDDRIAFGESILSATYRIPVESKMAIESPSKDKTQHSRRRDYVDATTAVGETEINRLERVMKDKLFQRSYATSSPFQVRKAFKFFDRECSMAISIEGFTRALEFLGFQFSELQNTALFGRYDNDLRGEIDYMRFITKAMFYSSSGEDAAPMPKPKKVPFVVPGTPTESKRDDKNADLYVIADVEANEVRQADCTQAPPSLHTQISNPFTSPSHLPLPNTTHTHLYTRTRIHTRTKTHTNAHTYTHKRTRTSC